MKRTPIYLGDAQDSKLARHAPVTRRTRSALIREAVARYLADTDSPRHACACKDVAEAAFGSVPELPPGEHVVEQIRSDGQTRSHTTHDAPCSADALSPPSARPTDTR